jgi:hypothetical protein
MIHIHKITTGGTFPTFTVTEYFFPKNPSGPNYVVYSPCSGFGSLCLLYSKWELAGTKEDAEEWTDVKFTVYRECRVLFPNVEPEGINTAAEKPHADGASLRVFVVEWALLRSHTADVVELRQMKHRDNTVSIGAEYFSVFESLDPPTVHDYGCGIGGASMGFALAGFDVTLGVEESEDQNIWKVVLRQQTLMVA